MAQSSVTAKRRLVLHFDINNTVLMSNKDKNMSTADNVARIVCKSAWGRLTVPAKDQQYIWELVHDQLSYCKPETPNLLANLAATDAETKIVSYREYIDTAFQPLVGAESETDKAEREDVRSKMQSKFAQPGGAGSKFKNTQEKILKNLALPKGAKDELGIQGDNGMEPLTEQEEVQKQADEEEEDEDAKKERLRKQFEKEMHRELYSDGRYHLTPSFFRTLMYLKK